jgi:hypothetical protein
MIAQTTTIGDVSPPRRPTGKRSIAGVARKAVEAVRNDWRTARFLPFAGVFVVIASLITAGYNMHGRAWPRSYLVYVIRECSPLLKRRKLHLFKGH